MSDAITEGIKEDRERAKLEFHENEKENAKKLEKLLEKIGKLKNELNDTHNEYGTLKQKFITFGYMIDDAGGLKISKNISW